MEKSNHKHLSTEEFLEYIKHYRHDWLNQIQIIKGCLSLGKVEEAQRYLDKVVLKAQDESRLSQLGLPALAFELLTYNWRQKKVWIAYEIDADFEQPDLTKRTAYFPQLEGWFMDMIKAVELNCGEEEENRLYLLFEIHDRVSIFVEFEGDWHQEAGDIIIHKLSERIKQHQGTIETKMETNGSNSWKLEVRLEHNEE